MEIDNFTLTFSERNSVELAMMKDFLGAMVAALSILSIYSYSRVIS